MLSNPFSHGTRRKGRPFKRKHGPNHNPRNVRFHVKTVGGYQLHTPPPPAIHSKLELTPRTLGPGPWWRTRPRAHRAPSAARPKAPGGTAPGGPPPPRILVSPGETTNKRHRACHELGKVRKHQKLKKRRITRELPNPKEEKEKGRDGNRLKVGNLLFGPLENNAK